MLTEQQMTDARRYAGYPLAGPVTDDTDTVYFFVGMVSMSLHARLTSLSASEESVIINYLTTLSKLEAAIISSADDLDTKKAAVWERNEHEIRDRQSLFADWRIKMCGFIGVPPGPYISQNAWLPVRRS